MKRIVSAFLLAAMLFTTVACLSSCGQEDNGAQISVYLSDRVYSFDPAGDYTDDATIAVMHLLYEPLFTLDDDGKVKEAAAEDYYFEKETGDLYITLRESYWTSGDRVTANDFIYAWRDRILSPNTSFTAAPLLYDIKNAKTIKNSLGTEEQNKLDSFGAIALDSATIRISFESSDVDRDAFLRNLSSIALSPVDRTSVLNQTEYWSSGTSSICYTNGPFKIRDLDNSAGYFTLTRHTDYHRPEDSKKADDYYVVPELLRTIWNMDEEMSEEAYSATLFDKMDEKAEDTVFYMSSLSLADRKESVKDAEVSDALSTYAYVFDTTNPLFSDARVRRVLSQVIDRTALVNLVTFGKPATGFISHGVWDSTSKREKKSFRTIGGELVSTTATLTIEAALTELNGVERGAFTLTYIDREEDQAIATYVSDLWKQLGYTVTLEPVSYYEVKQDTGGKDTSGSTIYSTYHVPALQRIYDSNLPGETGTAFDVIGIDYQMFSTNALTALASLSTTLNGCGVDLEAYVASTDPDKKIADFLRPNAAGYANAEYDTLINQAANTQDLKARATILHQAEAILMTDMPVIPLIFNQNYYVAHRYLKKLDVNYYGFTVFTRAKLRHYKDYFLS